LPLLQPPTSPVKRAVVGFCWRNIRLSPALSFQVSPFAFSGTEFQNSASSSRVAREAGSSSALLAEYQVISDLRVMMITSAQCCCTQLN